MLKAAPGFVGPPIDVAVLKKDGGDFRATFVDDDDLQEHLGYVEDADRHFGAWKRAEEAVDEIPEPPPP